MEKYTKKEKKLVDKINRKNTKQRHRTQFYYSFLTIILLICFIQMSFSALLNVTKVVAYNRKLSTLKEKQKTAKVKNEELRKEIKNSSTTNMMESIGRNNLKMAAPDEYMLILNEQQQTQTEQKNKHKKIGGHY